MDSDPLEQFTTEHQHALEQLDLLEQAAHALEAGHDVEHHLETCRRVHTFLTTAVREHNENEERALFPLLSGRAPVEIFEEEHAQLRRLERELEHAIQSPDPSTQVPRAAQEIVELLRAHIQREDEVLFPSAREILGTKGLSVLAYRL